MFLVLRSGALISWLYKANAWFPPCGFPPFLHYGAVLSNTHFKHTYSPWLFAWLDYDCNITTVSRLLFFFPEGKIVSEWHISTRLRHNSVVAHALKYGMVCTSRPHMAKAAFCLQQEHRMTRCVFPTHAYAFSGGSREQWEFRTKTWEEMCKERLIAYSVVCIQFEFMNSTFHRTRSKDALKSLKTGKAQVSFEVKFLCVC